MNEIKLPDYSDYISEHEKARYTKGVTDETRRLYQEDQSRLYAEYEKALFAALGIEGTTLAGAASSYAYEHGHSAGYHEVMQVLHGLAHDILIPAIQTLRK